MVKSALVTSEKKPIKITKNELESQMKKMRDYDEQPISGIFHNIENPRSGMNLGAFRFVFKLYKGQEPETYELYDGERYTLPRGVVNHINHNCYMKEHKKLPDSYGDIACAVPDGRYVTEPMTETRKIPRFRFERTDFDPEPERDVDISLVERAPL